MICSKSVPSRAVTKRSRGVNVFHQRVSPTLKAQIAAGDNAHQFASATTGTPEIPCSWVNEKSAFSDASGSMVTGSRIMPDSYFLPHALHVPAARWSYFYARFDAALLGYGNGQPSLSHSVHRRGQQRNVQRDVFRQLGIERYLGREGVGKAGRSSTSSNVSASLAISALVAPQKPHFNGGHPRSKSAVVSQHITVLLLSYPPKHEMISSISQRIRASAIMSTRFPSSANASAERQVHPSVSSTVRRA